MQNQDKKVNKNKLLILPLIAVLPAILIFDVIIYFVTRPTCLACGNLLEFIKTGSLTVFLLGGIGYQFRQKK
jgi:hypothetical protein